MELLVNPVLTELMYRVFYREPMTELSTEKKRIPLINQILKIFTLRLNDLKFNAETPSNNFIHFSKFYGDTFFNVSFGLEETSAGLSRAESSKQVEDLYGKLFNILKGIQFSSQIVNINQQLSTKGDSLAFLESLNPYTPKDFEKKLTGRGVYYTLQIPEHDLKIFITLVDSLLVPGGIYLSIENQFSANRYNFDDTFRIVNEQYEFIKNTLQIKLEGA